MNSFCKRILFVAMAALVISSIDIKGIPLASIKMGAAQVNPDYRAQEALPQVKDIGKELDVSAWRHRKLVRIDQPGLQQLDLDLETMSSISDLVEEKSGINCL